MTRTLPIGALLLILVPGANALDLADYRLVDLTHPYNQDTIYWPTSPSKFELERLDYGVTEGGWFYAANTVCTPEHGGTHFDAPIHFDADGQAAHAVPLAGLIAPAVMIDVSAQAGKDPNYRLTVDDVTAFEDRHGTIASPPRISIRIPSSWST